MTLALQFYDVLKFFHVLLALVWVGGAVILQVFAELALRSPMPGRAAAFAKEADFIGMKIFTPASILLLGVGLWLVHKGHWGYHFWTVGGLVGFAVSFVVGAGFLGPQAGKLATLIEANGPDAAVVKARVRTIVSIARVDTAILLAVVFLMATKLGQ